jgi:hypothetical protein
VRRVQPRCHCCGKFIKVSMSKQLVGEPICGTCFMSNLNKMKIKKLSQITNTISRECYPTVYWDSNDRVFRRNSMAP